jgi:hypothetical protein
MQKNITMWPSCGRQIRLSLLVFFIVGFLYPKAWSQSISTYTSSGTFVVPSNVNTITVECYGGGGGGGGTAVNPSRGGGGSGGAYARSILSVNPGTSYTVTVGAGGTAGSNSGGTGGTGAASSFSGGSNNVSAPGGAGGVGGTSTVPSGIGGIAATTGAIGSTVFYGGNGGDAGASSSGGGGSSAGSAANGVNASANTGGAAVTGGGKGANGRSTSGAGAAGSAPGGGGAGGNRMNTTARAGGVGGTGKVIVSYVCTAVGLPVADGVNTTTQPSCWGQTILVDDPSNSPEVSFDAVGTIDGPDPDEITYDIPTQEGSDMMIFNSYNCQAGSELRLSTTNVNTTGTSSVAVNFYMVNDGGYAADPDYVQVQYSLDGGTSWIDAGTPQYRVDATLDSFQWNQKSVTLPSNAANVPSLLIGFKFHSEFGNNIYLDNLNIVSSTPLPINLVSFTGKNIGTANQLNWVTAEEKNFDHFELERSADGQQFSKIANIDSKKSNVGNNYTFTDSKPLKERNFYRLKMQDMDGSFKYSEIVSLSEISTSGVSINMYPNPANHELNVQITGRSDGAAFILISDLVGNLVRSMQTTGSSTTINVDQLPTGAYLVKYIDNTNSVIKKIIKN